MLKKTLILSSILSANFAFANITNTTNWTVENANKYYETKQFCPSSIDEDECHDNKNSIERLININIDTFLKVKNIKTIQLDKISYTTTNTFPNFKNLKSKVSGLLMLPNTKIPKGIILYYHPTSFDKKGIPSNFNENDASIYQDKLLAAIYASHGYIVVAPDYIGLGDDSKKPHPYVLYPKQTVNTAFDLLNNSSKIIKQKYKLNNNAKLNVYSVGYSEGGAYSVWTAKCLQEKDKCNNSKLDKLYNFKASIGLDGAYSVSKATFDYLVEDTTKEKFHTESKLLATSLTPALALEAIFGYMKYGNKEPWFNFSTFDKDFYNMSCSMLIPQSHCNIKGKNINLKQLLERDDIGNKEFVDAVLFSAFFKKYSENKDNSHYGLPTDNNSIRDLIGDNILNDKGFKEALEKANVLDIAKTTNIPIYLYSLKNDSVVTPNNYHLFMKNKNIFVTGYLLNNNEIIRDSTLGISKNVDHISGDIYANLFAYRYINNLNKF